MIRLHLPSTHDPQMTRWLTHPILMILLHLPLTHEPQPTRLTYASLVKVRSLRHEESADRNPLHMLNHMVPNPNPNPNPNPVSCTENKLGWSSVFLAFCSLK